jgi:hypothetical protein
MVTVSDIAANNNLQLMIIVIQEMLGVMDIVKILKTIMVIGNGVSIIKEFSSVQIVNALFHLS